MFRLKICGITTIEDAQAAVAAGADAIGLNFFAGSPRVCAPERAQEIARLLPRHVCKVGVFVNATPQQIRAAVTTVGLDLVQLHGDEPPELLHELRGVPIMRAFRIEHDYEAVGEYLERCHRLACLPRMVLVDPLKPGQYGGTGATLDWQALSAGRAALGGLPLVLAGGLKPDNVADAIAAVRPWAVDTASGVETSPGKKSAEQMRAFVAAALAAFRQVASERHTRL
jgi:phosphoribosylanthranilate isomerase